MPRKIKRWPSGVWAAICDRCGWEYNSDQLKKEWNGLMTCPSCWEPRHPQDFLRAKPERVGVPWTRPEPADTFALVCGIDGISAYADSGTADCMQADNTSIALSVILDTLGNGH